MWRVRTHHQTATIRNMTDWNRTAVIQNLLHQRRCGYLTSNESIVRKKSRTTGSWQCAKSAWCIRLLVIDSVLFLWNTRMDMVDLVWLLCVSSSKEERGCVVLLTVTYYGISCNVLRSRTFGLEIAVTLEKYLLSNAFKFWLFGAVERASRKMLSANQHEVFRCRSYAIAHDLISRSGQK